MKDEQRGINTARASAVLRAKAIDRDGRRVLISRLAGSGQEGDLSVPTNCQGFGRIRHFRQKSSPGWPMNPLPIVPAATALGLPVPDKMEAQVFQNAACAWRCWYCFVPYNLLRADTQLSEWLSPDDLVRMYCEVPDAPALIDLSGGSPDLVPEWVPWMMTALKAAGIDRTTYLWSDDNLSTTYLLDEMSQEERDLMASYPNYGRVCCFKGFDSRSFAFNTRAAEADFDRQFEIMQRLLATGLDVYGYVTLTAPDEQNLPEAMARFFDRLQALDPIMPLRTVPLMIAEFNPVKARMNDQRRASLLVQQKAIEAWNAEIERRFSAEQRALDITTVRLQTRP